MANEALKLIKQQPLDQSDPNKYYPFPALAGLTKPPRPSTQPTHRLPLQLTSDQERGEPAQGTTTVSASPFHGITRLAVVADDKISQTFNNGKGDVNEQGQVLQGGKKGRYYDEVEDMFTIDPQVDKPKICWKVRNTDGFTKARFELFSRDQAAPIWSLSWDKAQIAANIRTGSMTAGAKVKDGQSIPIRWSGSLGWAETIKVSDPAYPDGRLTAEHSPYQLRLTINDGDPGPNKMGYPLIAWTYIYVSQEAEGLRPPSSITGQSWIEIELKDDEGNPVAEEPYVIQWPNGASIEGKLDLNGYARINGIAQGACKVIFPRRDAAWWEPTPDVDPPPLKPPEESIKAALPIAKTAWLEIELVDEYGQPVPNEPYRVEAANGIVIEGELDSAGYAKLDPIAPGGCKVIFPRRDAAWWESTPDVDPPPLRLPDEWIKVTTS